MYLRANGDHDVTDQIFSTAMQERDETAKISRLVAFNQSLTWMKEKARNSQDESQKWVFP